MYCLPPASHSKFSSSFSCKLSGSSFLNHAVSSHILLICCIPHFLFSISNWSESFFFFRSSNYVIISLAFQGFLHKNEFHLLFVLFHRTWYMPLFGAFSFYITAQLYYNFFLSPQSIRDILFISVVFQQLAQILATRT